MTQTDHISPPVAGVLLAAGAGRRLGGRPKALLPHHGRPLVEHAARALRAGGCSPVHIVLGAEADRVRDSARLGEYTVLHNPDWSSGMGGSLRTALASLDGAEVAGALVCLVDQPGIGPAAVARVRARLHTPHALAAAAYGGRRGHPVLFGSAHWPGIAAGARGDSGARAYLAEHAAQLTLVECGDIADPADIDTPEDLHRLGQ